MHIKETNKFIECWLTIRQLLSISTRILIRIVNSLDKETAVKEKSLTAVSIIKLVWTFINQIKKLNPCLYGIVQLTNSDV